MNRHNTDWIKQAGSFLAEFIDDLFLNGFRFKQEDAPKYMRHFCFKGNSIYITCFEKPEFVLSYYCDRNRIRIKSINSFKALIWGFIIKDIIAGKY